LTKEEQNKLRQLAYELDLRLPSTRERAEARIAYQIIQEVLDRRVADLQPEVRERVVKEVKAQLQELITGSRRP
jgi:hypothetical protein